MKSYIRILLCTCLLVSVSAVLRGQQMRSDTLHLDIKFRNASSKIEPGYRDNAANIEAFRSALEAYLQDGAAVIRTVNVRTAASPSGTSEENRRMVRSRARSIEALLADKMGLDRDLFNIEPVGEDWEGLGRLVAQLDTTWRDEVLDIINCCSAPEKGEDPRKILLRHLDDGRVYWWLSTYLFPELCATGGSVDCVIDLTEAKAEPVALVASVEPEVPAEEPAAEPIAEPVASVEPETPAEQPAEEQASEPAEEPVAPAEEPAAEPVAEPVAEPEAPAAPAEEPAATPAEQIAPKALDAPSTPLVLNAQEYRTDTLRLDVFFHKNRTEIDPAYHDNARSLEAFRALLEYHLRDNATTVEDLVIRSSASPEGPYDNNVRLARERGESIGAWLEGTKGLDPASITYDPIPEDWDGLAEMLTTIDQPWRDEAIRIVSEVPQWTEENGRQVESRKDSMRALNGGAAWAWLDRNVFPELRAAGGSVECILLRPTAVSTTVRDTVIVQQVDTVVNVKTETILVPTAAIPVDPFKGKKMIMAVRTNILAVPLANFGIEVPLGETWSVAADYYYPWLWRPLHKEGLDADGRCFELQAVGVEGRYWFPNRKKWPEQRLLGHSVGLYGAVGHYDFERNFTGDQGEFYNVGLDYMYAAPIFNGKMHMEFELGVGYIYSPSQPYDTFVAGDKAYRRKGYTRYTRWFGPTRAQISLVVPIYVKTSNY